MGGRWPRVDAISPVSRVDTFMRDDLWAEVAVPPARRVSVPVVVLRANLRALYAPTPEEIATWPLLGDGGVVTEIRNRS